MMCVTFQQYRPWINFIARKKFLLTKKSKIKLGIIYVYGDLTWPKTIQFIFSI